MGNRRFAESLPLHSLNLAYGLGLIEGAEKLDHALIFALDVVDHPLTEADRDIQRDHAIPLVNLIEGQLDPLLKGCVPLTVRRQVGITQRLHSLFFHIKVRCGTSD